MKPKKTGFAIRALSLFLALLVVFNIALPAMAAYSYDADRAAMISHPAYQALKYLGFDRNEWLEDNGYLFKQGYIGNPLKPDRYDCLTEIGYSDYGKGTETTTSSNGYTDVTSVTGKYPDVDAFVDTGLDCVDYITYYLVNYLPNIEGAPVDVITDAMEYLQSNGKEYHTRYDHMEFWNDARDYFKANGVKVYEVTETSGNYEIDEYINPLGETKTDDIYNYLEPGALIQMGEPTDFNGDGALDYTIHYAIYAGTYEGIHYMYHSTTAERGPEISRIDWLNPNNTSGSKMSVPLYFYEFPLEENYGSIEVYKTDEEGKPLAGAKFLILNTETGEDWDITTDETGYAMQDELPLGTYTVKELIPPMGYKLVDTVWTIKLTKKDPTGGGTIHVTNKQLKGSLKIQKLILPTSMSTPENLAGWKFEVLNKKGMTVGTYTTGTEGFVQVNDLPIGTYYVQEVDTVKEDWEYDTEQKTVEVTAGHTAEAPAVVSFSNQYLNGGLQIKKITEDSKYPAGWQFGVYAEPGCSESSRMDTASTDPQGIATFSSLPAGTYWVKELGHTSPTVNELYHCASDNPQEVTVAAGATATVEFRNDLNRGDIEIIKEGDDEEKTKLPGATFAIFDANGNALTITDPDGNRFYSFTDNGDGTYSMKGLPYGTYIVKEVAPPAGYNLGAVTEWTITVGSQTLVDGKVTFTVQNTKEVGDLALQKVTEDGKNKEGWLFAVYADADCTNMVAGPKATDGEGKLTFTKLAPGEYWVKELGHENSDIEALYYCNGDLVFPQ